MATQFNSIPGITFVTPEGTIKFTPPPQSGDTILLLGNALDGPVGSPQLLANFRDLEAAFGPITYNTSYPSPDGDTGKLGTFSGNTLIKAAREIIMGGGSRILLVRVGGISATGAAIFNGSVNVSGVFPGSVYNGATLNYQVSASSGTTIICTQPAAKGGSFTSVFTTLTTFEAICASVNNDPRNQTFKLTPAAGGAAQISNSTTAGFAVAPTTVTLALGTNGTLRDDYAGLSKHRLYNDIVGTNGIFDQIRGTSANILYVAGLYADDCVVNPLSAASGTSSVTSFLTDLATYCYTESRDNYPMIGMIGLNPLRATDSVSVNTRYNNLINSSQTAFADASMYRLSMAQFIASGIPFTDNSLPGSPIVDMGAYVSMHAGPDVVFSDAKLGQYIDTPAAVYTGLVAGLPPQIGTTNYPLPGTIRLAYRYSKPQINILNAGINFGGSFSTQGGGSYVTMFYRSLIPANPLLVTVDDVTCAARTSSFANLQTLRIVQAAEDVVEYIAGQFLGKPNNTGTITALDTQLQAGLDVLANQGALVGGKGSGYSYQILSGANSITTLGLLNIVLTLRPSFEIRQIVTTVSVSAG